MSGIYSQHACVHIKQRRQLAGRTSSCVQSCTSETERALSKHLQGRVWVCECVCDVIYYFCNLQFFRIGPKLDQILLFLCLCDFCHEDLTFSPFSSVSVLSSSPLSSLCLLVPYTHPGFARFCPFPWRCDSSLLLSSSISLSCLHVFLLCCLFCDSSQETPKQQDRDTPDVHLLYQPQTTGALPPPPESGGKKGLHREHDDDSRPGARRFRFKRILGSGHVHHRRCTCTNTVNIPVLTQQSFWDCPAVAQEVHKVCF